MDRRQKLRRIRALIIKESYQIVRDPSSMLVAFGIPLLLLFIYGFGVNLDMDNLKVGLVLEDTTPDMQSFATSMTNSRFFNVTRYDEPQVAFEDMIDGKLRGVVVVPFYFSEYRRRPDEIAPIQVITDGSEPNTANFVFNYVQAAWSQWLQQQRYDKGTRDPPQTRLQQRVWYNEELNSRYFLFPGSIAIIMTLIGTLLTALVISREWERGTMEALMATPVTIGEIVWSKLIPYYVLGLGSMAICTFVAIVGFDIPFRGSFVVLVVVSSAFLAAALGLGLLISTVARSQYVASQMATVSAFLPAFMLSGFIFEISSMPTIIQGITYAIPARYFVSSLLTLFLVGDVWALLLPATLMMLVIAGVFYTLVSIKLVKRLD